jgi:hypothetical protein
MVTDFIIIISPSLPLIPVEEEIMAFEIKVPNMIFHVREKTAGEWGSLRSEKLYNLYC